MTPYFEYRHVVGLEETNVTGNVYFANHVRWQGRCREMFLHTHAPGIIAELRNGLSLLTVSCSCDYSAELFALDHVSVRLFLEDQILNRLTLRFEYWRVSPGPEELVARGSQQIACMRRGPSGIESIAVPVDLLQALLPFRRG
jgi:enediyne biosynthesis thioesterase